MGLLQPPTPYALATMFFSDLNILTLLLLHHCFMSLHYTGLNNFMWLKFLPSWVPALGHPSQFRPSLTYTLSSTLSLPPMRLYHISTCFYFFGVFLNVKISRSFFSSLFTTISLIESKDIRGRNLVIFFPTISLLPSTHQ